MFMTSLCVSVVLVWCIGSGFSFFCSYTTNLASVLYTCIFMYFDLRLKSEHIS